MSNIYKAINIAAALHDGQKRKGDSLPYIVHPLIVGLILMDYTNDEDIIAAGILHDTLEDTIYSKEELERDFNPRIAQFVLGVTEPAKPLPWRERKNGYLGHLVTAGHEARLICAADKLHNLQSMIDAFQKYGESAFEKFNAPSDKKLWFYEECLKILQKDPDMPQPLLEAIESAINSFKSLTKE